MIEKISWSNFNYSQFQSFCNILLSYEISKKVIPFAADGKDYGFDAKYEGEYQGNNGLWRFQYKFHTTPRATAISQLASEIEKDIASNVKDEANLIFLTNVLLLPQDIDRLSTLAYSAVKKIGKQINFQVWDGEKLSTLLVRYPIIKLWLNEGFETAQLQDFNYAFHEQMNARISDAYTLGNYFSPREESIQALENFLYDGTAKFAIISGEAGIGKTRLCLEFFKKLASEDNWVPLVLINYSVDFDKIKNSLSGEKNFIILIDDAHNYKPEVIADFKALTELKSKNKVKVILTSREISINESLKLIKEHKKADISIIQLKRLTPEGTKSVFEHELKGSGLLRYINELIQISDCRPLLIVSLIKAIKNNIPIGKIREDGFLQNYVSRYFDAFIDEISVTTAVSHAKLKSLVNLVCLIEPINTGDPTIKALIQQSENIDAEVIDLFFQKLRNYRFAAGKYELSITPDYYSDIILAKAVIESNWLNNKSTLFEIQIHNIIRNLASIEEITKVNLLDDLLEYLLGLIDTVESYRIDQILNTIRYVSPAKPIIAAKAVEKVIYILEHSDHTHHKAFKNSISIKNYSDSRLNICYSILRELITLGYLDETFRLTLKLYKITNDKGTISSVFGFNRKDSYQNYPCVGQSYLINKIKAIFGEAVQDTEFALEACKALLILSYNESGSHYFEKYKVTITTFYVSEHSAVRKLRFKIIETLIFFFNGTDTDQLKEKILGILIDIPREIISVQGKSGQYKGTEEIGKVLLFCEELSKMKISIKLKDTIGHQLYWYLKWKINPQFKPTIDRIIENIKPQNLTEKILQFFKSAGQSEEIDNSNESFYKKATALLEGEKIEDIGASLIAITDSFNNPPHYFYMLIESVQKLNRINELIDVVWNKNQEFVARYMGGSLRYIGFQINDHDYFWKYIELLYSKSDSVFLNCILWIYSFLAPDDIKKLRKKEKVLITEIYKKRSLEINYQLAFALPNFLVVDEKEISELLIDFFKDCSQREVDHVFHRLSQLPEFADLTDYLLVNCTMDRSFSYEIEKNLSKALSRNGFGFVFELVKRRFFYKRERAYKEGKFVGYEIVPTHRGNMILEKLDPKERLKCFEEVLKWYVSMEFQSLESFYQSDILEYFAPSLQISNEIEKLFLSLFDSIRGDSTKLTNMASALSIFTSKNEKAVNLIVDVYLLASESLNGDQEAMKDVRSECYMAIRNSGVKSGTPGEPFPFDLLLKELLQKSIEKYRNNFIALEFLQKCLGTVESEIARSIEDE